MTVHAEAQQKSASAAPSTVTARTAAATAPGIAPSPAVQRLQDLSRSLNTRPEVVAQRALGAKLSAASSVARRAPANRTGLPDALKAGVEALSGQSLDDVRVHRNSGRPAQLQAHAYAQGTDIHVAPGQERHLPHEAWHVVQQKQGRVRPTMQLEGAAINDDAGLEREADLMGARATGHRGGGADRETLQRVGADGAQGVVQRAVGFEWEVDSIKLYEVTKARDRGEPAELPSKAVAFRRGGVRLEVDSGHGEFVTEPAETMNQLEAQLNVIQEVIQDLMSAPGRTLYMTAPGVIVYTDDSEHKLGQPWMAEGEWIRVTSSGSTMSGTFQATSGIDFTPEALQAELRGAVANLRKGEQESWTRVFDAADQAAGADLGAGTRTLIIAVEYFIAACSEGNPKAEDGPKTWMPLLLRTDFRSMFNALAPMEQEEFTRWAAARASDSRLCPGGYIAGGQREPGPTIREWLASICASAAQSSANREADKDLMSPPPGFKRHLTRQAREQDAAEGKPVADPIPYAMGLYGLDRGRIIAERRSMTRQGGLQSGRVNFEEMAALAREFAESHGLRTFDVAPPEPLSDFEDGVEYLDEDDQYTPPIDMVEEDDLDTSALRGERNWYKKLCDAAKETVAKYGRGMFDYRQIGGDDDDLGSTPLTPEHYALFQQIRARRPDLALNPSLLAYVFDEGADLNERIDLYADIEDSR